MTDCVLYFDVVFFLKQDSNIFPFIQVPPSQDTNLLMFGLVIGRELTKAQPVQLLDISKTLVCFLRRKGIKCC